jgi:hypothetical protein
LVGGERRKFVALSLHRRRVIRIEFKASSKKMKGGNGKGKRDV